MRRVWLERIWRTDWILLGSILTLTSIGLLMIYSISNDVEQVSLLQFRKQMIAVLLGLIAMVALAFVDYRQTKSLAPVIYIAGFILLITVLFFGATIRGTQGWFKFGNITVQPVELVKVCFAVFIASYFAKNLHKRLQWTAFFGSLFAMLGYVVPILLQPDFGSAMVIVGMWLIGVAFAGLRLRTWLVLITLGALCIGLTWNYGLQPYQKARLISFVDPNIDPLGSGYNVIQAQTAIGSGGWFGKGVGEGSQSRLRFLPEASTDFMFAVMGEELGFMGIGLILILFGTLLIRTVWIAYRSSDTFAGIYCVMISGMFGLHILINAGMNMGIMPVTGIPLPFASAAASSLIAGYAALGIVQSISIYTQPAER